MASHKQTWRTCDVCGEQYEPDLLPKFAPHANARNDQSRVLHGAVRIWRPYKRVNKLWHIIKTPSMGMYSSGVIELDLCLKHRTAVEEALTV